MTPVIPRGIVDQSILRVVVLAGRGGVGSNWRDHPEHQDLLAALVRPLLNGGCGAPPNPPVGYAGYGGTLGFKAVQVGRLRVARAPCIQSLSNLESSSRRIASDPKERRYALVTSRPILAAVLQFQSGQAGTVQQLVQQRVVCVEHSHGPLETGQPPMERIRAVGGKRDDVRAPLWPTSSRGCCQGFCTGTALKVDERRGKWSDHGFDVAGVGLDGLRWAVQLQQHPCGVLVGVAVQHVDDGDCSCAGDEGLPPLQTLGDVRLHRVSPKEFFTGSSTGGVQFPTHVERMVGLDLGNQLRHESNLSQSSDNMPGRGALAAAWKSLNEDESGSVGEGSNVHGRSVAAGRLPACGQQLPCGRRERRDSRSAWRRITSYGGALRAFVESQLSAARHVSRKSARLNRARSNGISSALLYLSQNAQLKLTVRRGQP